jgi:hypothetical protein
MERFSEVVSLRMPSDALGALKRQARDDDRSLASYLRRLLVRAAQATPAAQVAE